MQLTALRLPVDWPALGFADPALMGDTTLAGGPAAWQWSGPSPQLGVETFSAAEGTAVAGWGVDHAVVLTPDIETTVDVLCEAAVDLRLRTAVKGRRTAFFRAGPIVEVIEESVRAPRLYGVALWTEESLDDVAGRWKEAGFAAGAPHDAIQKGRRIFSVAAAGAGLAVLDVRREI